MNKSFKNKRSSMYDLENLQTLYSTFFLTLFTTRTCNANCEYCDVIYRDKRNHKMVTVEEFNKLVEFILNQDIKRPNINLHFFGGEPTLNPSLLEFVTIAKEKLEEYNLNMVMTTNLSRSEVYYEKFKDVKIIGSFHSSTLKTYDEWYSKAKDLNRFGNFQHAVMMVTKENMDFIYDLYIKWSKEFKCVLVPIDQIYNDKDYITFKEKIISEMDYDPFEHDEEYLNFYDIDNPMNKSMGLMCSSGMLVDEYGNVDYCFPRFGENVFNVFENPDYKLKQFHFCNKMCERCDLEVIRSSIDFYNKNLKNRPYTVNNKVLYQCNA